VKFINPVCVNILSPLTLEAPSDFIHTVQTFCASVPQLMPGKWGWSEPLDRNFDVEDIDALIPENGICQTIYWQRKDRPKAEGSLAVRWRSQSPKVRDTHSNISFTVQMGQVDQSALVNYLKAASLRSKADLALLDTLTEPYRNFAIESGSAPYGERFMVVTHLLRHWLPDVFWATVFGPPYVQLLGKERLLGAPAYVVEEIGPDMIYVQLTESLAGALEDSAGLQSQRKLFKEHFLSNAFFISGQGYDRLQRGPVGDVFAVPTFVLAEDSGAPGV
jgi:hypothetical protein